MQKQTVNTKDIKSKKQKPIRSTQKMAYNSNDQNTEKSCRVIIIQI